jgi:hypothetical protein
MTPFPGTLAKLHTFATPISFNPHQGHGAPLKSTLRQFPSQTLSHCVVWKAVEAFEKNTRRKTHIRCAVDLCGEGDGGNGLMNRMSKRLTKGVVIVRLSD